MKILLLEDNVNDAIIIQRTIKKSISGVTLIRVDTEKEYRRHIKGDYDIVLSDYSMPEFTGMDALRYRNKKYPFMPFIIVTGSVNETTAVECMMEGADNYIIKEHLGRLVPAIKKAIKDKQNEKAKKELEEKLIYQSNMYNDLVEKSQMGIVYESADEKFIYANSRFCQITGYSVEELKVVNYKSLIYKQDIPLVLNKRELRKNKRIPNQDYEIRILTKNNSIVWLSVHVESDFDEQAQLIGQRFYIKDITKEKYERFINEAVNDITTAAVNNLLFEDFLRESYEIVKKYLSLNNYIIATYNEDNKSFAFPFFVNNQVGRNEIISRVEKSLIGYVKKTGKPLLAQREEILQMIEDEKVQLDSLIPASVFILPLFFESKFLGVMAVCDYTNTRVLDKNSLKLLKRIANIISIKIYQEDIRLKKEADEKKFRELYMFSPTAIIVHQYGKIVMANPAAVALAEADDISQMIGGNVMQYIHPSMKKAVETRIHHVIENKEIQEAKRERFKTLKGNELIVEVISLPFEFEGKPAAQVIVKDVTEEEKAKRLLLQSEERFRKLFQSTMDAVVLSELETGKFIEVSKGFYSQTGYKPEDIKGEGNTAITLNVWYSPKQRDVLLKKILEAGYITNVEVTYRKKNGEPLHGLLSASIVEFDNKKYVISSIRDISAIKEAQRQLKESQEKFNEIFNAASDAIILYSYVDGDLLFHDVNKTFLKLYSYDAEEIIGKSVKKIIAEDSVGKMKSRLDKVLAGENIIFESEHVSKDGKKIPVEVSAKKITIGNENYILSIERDITDRLNAQRALRDSEEKFRLAFNNTPDALAIINLKTGKAVELNKGFEEITGYDVDKILSEGAGDFIQANMKAFNEMKNMKPENGKTVVHEFPLVDRTGKEKIVLASASLIMLKNIPHLLIIAKDISSLKKTQRDLEKAKEKAEESDRLKSAFLSNMSHEIRTPMNHIIGFTEFIKQGVSEEDLKNYIDIIQKSSHHLLNLINDIIDISKIEAGQFKMFIEDFNPKSIMKELHSSFKFDTRVKNNKELVLVNEAESTRRYKITGDRQRLRQVLINLVGNAVKFTSKGRISFGYEDRGDGFLTFYVKDTGAGIKKEDQKLIFDRFRQAGNRKNSSIEGTGLGLALSKAFVEMMGGKIWVESEPGKGSAFFFTVPLKQQKNSGIVEEGRHEKLLLFDSVPEDVFLIKTLLKRRISKDNVLVATSLSQVRKIFDKEQGFFMALINIEKDADVFKILNLLKEELEIPVFAMVDYHQQIEEYGLLDKGFDGVIEKPFTKQKLEKLLDEVD